MYRRGIDNFEAISWDFDDTLIDSFPNDTDKSLHGRSGCDALAEFGRRYDLPSLQDITIAEKHKDFTDAVDHSVAGGNWVTLRRHGVVSGDYDPHHPYLVEIGKIKAELFEAMLVKEGKEVEGANAILAAIAETGKKQLITSSSPYQPIDVGLKHVLMSRHIFNRSDIVAEEDVSKFKPHPEPFSKALLAANLPISHIDRLIHVEDTPRNANTASRIGMFAIGLARPGLASPDDFRKVDFPPSLIVESLPELADFLGLDLAPLDRTIQIGYN